MLFALIIWSYKVTPLAVKIEEKMIFPNFPTNKRLLGEFLGRQFLYIYVYIYILEQDDGCLMDGFFSPSSRKITNSLSDDQFNIYSAHI